MKGQKKLTRREMLKLSGTVAAGSVLAAACASAVAPTPVPPTPVPPTVAPTAVPPTVAPTKVPPTSAPAPAVAAGPVTLEVYNPSGAFAVTQTFSARLDTLAGKTICEVMNGSWRYEDTFPLIRELLQKQFPTAKFITYDKFPALSKATDVAGLEDAVKAAGCQAVIVGNAG